MKDQSDALVQWIAEQQRANSLSPKHPAPELHLHQHHYPAPPEPRRAVPPPHDDYTVRVPPLVAATYMLFLSVALALPLALIGAIVNGDRPSVHYIQPSQGNW